MIGCLQQEVEVESVVGVSMAMRITPKRMVYFMDNPIKMDDLD